MRENTHFTITNSEKNKKYHLESLTTETTKPDFYGLYFILADTFLTKESVPDFLFLSRNFLIRNNNLLEKYKDYFFPEYVYSRNGVNAMLALVKNIIFGASSHQNKDASDILLTLYKTYHKSEYNQLKKFQTLKDNDIISIFDVNIGTNVPLFDIVRVISMAIIMGKQIDVSCFPLIEKFNTIADEILEDEFEEYKTDDEREDKETLRKRYGKILSLFPFYKDNGIIIQDAIEKHTASYLFVGEFINNTLIDFKIGTDELDFITEDGNPFLNGMTNDDYVSEAMKVTNILYKCFPLNYKGEMSRDDKVKSIIENDEFFNLLIGLYRTVEFFSCIMKDMINAYDLTMGLTGENQGVTEKLVSMKKEFIEQAQVTIPRNKKNLVQENKKDDEYKTDNYKIMDLKSKLKIQKSEIISLREEISELKKQIFIHEASLAEAKSEKDELVHLRDYLYNLTSVDEDEDKSYANILEMKEFIAQKSICIIGGHQNWIKKLKKEFPNWVYIVPKIGPTFNPTPLLKADYIYFFTDILKHSTYYSCIATCRENNLDYDYIHGVNLDKMVVDIYRNFKKKGVK